MFKSAGNKLNLLLPSRKAFPLYLPREKLCFKQHPKYGRVHTLYLADTEVPLWKKAAHTWTAPLAVLGLNINYLLVKAKILLPNSLYFMLSLSDLLGFAAIILNYLLFSTKMSFERAKQTRVKELYLKPDGKSFIFVNFMGESRTINNIDISDKKITYRFNLEGERVEGKESVFDCNYNSFRANCTFLGGNEMIFDGNFKQIDHEILNNVLYKYDIETKEVKFRENPVEMAFWTREEKDRVLNYFSSRKVAYKQKLKQTDYFKLKSKYRITSRK